MSETKHSPEPWTWSADESPWHGGGRVRMGGPERVFDASEADARRIVACVNACAGIPTIVLETWKPGELWEVLQRPGKETQPNGRLK